MLRRLYNQFSIIYQYSVIRKNLSRIAKIYQKIKLLDLRDDSEVFDEAIRHHEMEAKSQIDPSQQYPLLRCHDERGEKFFMNMID